MTFTTGQVRRLARTLADMASLAQFADGEIQAHDMPDLQRTLGLIAQDAHSLARALMRKPAPAKRLPEPTRKAKKKARDESRREEMRALRAAVMKRANGFCELCGAAERPGDPLQLHHTISGSGRRRQQQSPENCVAAHMSCHERQHAGKGRSR